MSDNFVKVDPFEFNYSAFELINKDWLQITGFSKDRVNSMTASWGGLGVMWNKPVAFIFVRPQRFTKTLLDADTKLSLQVLPEENRKASRYLGKVTGFNEDKVKGSGLNVDFMDGFAYYKESDIVMKCHKYYAQDLKEENFFALDMIDKWYPDKDFHTMYIVYIEELLVKESFFNKHPELKK